VGAGVECVLGGFLRCVDGWVDCVDLGIYFARRWRCAKAVRT
jgi:hypothetical protein